MKVDGRHSFCFTMDTASKAFPIISVRLLRESWKQSPWLVAFTFGLLHGFGFAGALSEIGLPEQAIPLSLLFFNVGVEVGQLMFVAVVLAIQFAASKLKIQWPDWSAKVAPYAIGSLAMFWAIERVVGFW